ncbi:substrate-binding domain-containing protein [Bradyrhizobium sp. ISRA443]|uniref:substrate-binding domain-containing protein n=1 Tax=unclassified Bradyrhizobium TaxID=2631580 RepID=UPI00247AD3DF|nr:MULTISPECIES: substrate-binding domain-containing protein [unclassified Bradyrhizobium]WGR99143.1 substrate-binding domain-containing protein [Bradyrhizobium sp. ISRA436]WGS06034.1 substrate-binding domain-containing protein [Bradyrhizobium sp. ISRA437]WGS12920.1 substrate-binding domain-containing protein [Bradyrhizobium sp. ISRA443]
MHATVNFQARSGLAAPPSLLLRNLSAPADRAMSPGDRAVFRQRGADRRLRVGGFICCTGSPGVWGPSAICSAQLAVAEINKRGGILGREVELSIYDAGGTLDEVIDRAEQAIAFDGIDLMMGLHTSAVRVALRKVTRNRVPYVYTPLYEGGERTTGVMAIGETPRWQMRPAIHWLAEAKKASRWYLIGSDYVWPWQSHRAVKAYIAESGGHVVGEEFVPVGEDNHAPHLARIRAARPDVVLISLIGTDSITFNRAFGECGLGATTLRLAGAMDETVLLGIGADNSEGLFCASGYFPSVGSRANDDFMDRYRAMFGPYAPPIGSVGQSNYEGLRFLEAVANHAGSLSMAPFFAASRNIVYGGARGPVIIRDGRAEMPMYLAEADGLDFKVIRTV